VGTSQNVIAGPAADVESLQREAHEFGSVDRVARVLTILGDASNDMRIATNQRLVLEIAFTRIARPETDLSLDGLAERVADLERQVAALSVPGAVAHPIAQPTPVPQPPARQQSVPQPPSQPAQAPKAQAVPVPQPAQSPQLAPMAAPMDDGELQRTWRDVVNELVSRVPSKGSLLMSSSAVSDDGSKLTVSLPKGSHFAARMLERSDVRDVIAPVVSQIVGPRELVYVESSLANQAIARADRARAPQPDPQPTVDPRPTPAPAQSYPTPWDPTPQSSPADTDDPVPYDDTSATAYEEDLDSTPISPSPQPAATPTPAEDTPLPNELASIASMLEDAFGQSIKTVIEENGEDADEMARDDIDVDAGGEGDAFADESVYDGEEDADDDE
jgi:DNA polymerase-3 subunit gamma/tau